MSTYVFNTRSVLTIAVNAWIDNQTEAKNAFGDINNWNVSAITDFSNLFRNKTTFNSDISDWDVSNGIRFDYMFYNASSLKFQSSSEMILSLQNNNFKRQNFTSVGVMGALGRRFESCRPDS